MKKPSVTFTVRPASGAPRACSLDFIKIPGTLSTPLPSGGNTNVIFHSMARRQRRIGVAAERHRHPKLALGDVDVGTNGDIGLAVDGLDLLGAPHHRTEVLFAHLVGGVLVIQHNALASRTWSDRFW